MGTNLCSLSMHARAIKQADLHAKIYQGKSIIIACGLRDLGVEAMEGGTRYGRGAELECSWLLRSFPVNPIIY